MLPVHAFRAEVWKRSTTIVIYLTVINAFMQAWMIFSSLPDPQQVVCVSYDGLGSRRG